MAKAEAEPTPVDGLRTEGILPNLDRIVGAWNAQRFPVLFYAPDGNLDACGGLPKRMLATDLGWDGGRAEFAAMTRQQITRYADARQWSDEDAAAAATRARWLRRKGGTPRLLVFCNGGPLYLNFDAETGFTPEPGT